MNPYCVLVLDNQTPRQTQVVKRGGRNVTWNEEFLIPYNNEASLFVSVLKETIRSDNLVGTAILKLDLIQSEYSGKIQLSRKDQKSAGTLNITITFMKNMLITACKWCRWVYK